MAAVNLAEVNDLFAVFSDFIYAGNYVGQLRQPVLVAMMPSIACGCHCLGAGLSVGERLRNQFVAMVSKATHQRPPVM
jgi:hypothetical protein